MKASNTEIYNAIHGTSSFDVSDVESLISAIQRTETDALSFNEVGRMYVAMVYDVAKGQRERSASRAQANSDLLKAIAMPRYDLTEKGIDHVDALRQIGAA